MCLAESGGDTDPRSQSLATDRVTPIVETSEASDDQPSCAPHFFHYSFHLSPRPNVHDAAAVVLRLADAQHGPAAIVVVLAPEAHHLTDRHLLPADTG